MSDIEFIPGLIAKAPSDKAPDFVKLRLSIKREELLAWLQSQSGEWINADVKESRNGKLYCAVDSWKPNQGERQESRKPVQSKAPPADSFDDDSDLIPF